MLYLFIIGVNVHQVKMSMFCNVRNVLPLLGKWDIYDKLIISITNHTLSMKNFSLDIWLRKWMLLNDHVKHCTHFS